MRPPVHARRGQSLVELTLGLIVFVTVLMFGIHFAEVGYLSIKVHEAAVSPLWDATALRVFRMQPNPSKIANHDTFPGIAPAVEADAQRRYLDFDGRSSTPGGAPAMSHVFTRIERMEVECEREDRVEFDLPRGAAPSPLSPVAADFPQTSPGTTPGSGTDSPLEEVYENLGGISCHAKAKLETLPALPLRFLEGDGGFFKARHGKRLRMNVCSVGRAAAGNECKGRYAILLGDFAFADTDVSGQCPLQPERPDAPCGQNRTYYLAAKSVYDHNHKSSGRDASHFAEFFVGYSPINEEGFFMSYRGEEDGFIEQATPAGEAKDEVDRPRNTGGPDHKSRTMRRPSNSCFLGLDGC
jgi:hypothetical protein